MKVGVAASARPWRRNLQRHCHAIATDLCVELLRHPGEADDADVVIVDDETSWLSSAFVNQCHDRAQTVIGMFDPADAEGFGRARLTRIGVKTIRPATTETKTLVTLIRAHHRADCSPTGRTPLSRRQIIAVGGPAGAGSTEVSLAVGQGLAGRGIRPVLVDVDEVSPTLAPRLGLALQPHLLDAVDAARGDESALDPWAAALAGVSVDPLRRCLARPMGDANPLPFDVVVGLARRTDWSLARASDVAELVGELSANWPAVVVRLGSRLEAVHGERYEISRAAVARASRVVGVCDASPIGLLRFVDWLVDALTVVDDRSIDVVLNRAPNSRRAIDDLVGQLRLITGDRLDRIVSVGSDDVVSRAGWDGSLAIGSRLSKVVGELL